MGEVVSFYRRQGAMKSKPVEVRIAEEPITCASCCGTIPEGHRYWWRNSTHTAEHTNCEIYTPEYTKLEIMRNETIQTNNG